MVGFFDKLVPKAPRGARYILRREEDTSVLLTPASVLLEPEQEKRISAYLPRAYLRITSLHVRETDDDVVYGRGLHHHPTGRINLARYT